MWLCFSLAFPRISNAPSLHPSHFFTISRHSTRACDWMLCNSMARSTGYKFSLCSRQIEWFKLQLTRKRPPPYSVTHQTAAKEDLLTSLKHTRPSSTPPAILQHTRQPPKKNWRKREPKCLELWRQNSPIRLSRFEIYAIFCTAK